MGISRLGKVLGLMVLISLMVLPACTPQATPAAQGTTPTGQPAKVTEPAKDAWQAKWDQTVAAAKKEGKLTVYSGMSADFRVGLSDAFRNKYGIELDFVPGKGSELAQRVFTERRAQLFNADIFIIGSGSLLTTIKPEGFLERLDPLLILPEVTDEKAWVQNKIPYMDPKDHRVIGFGFSASSFVAANPETVKDGDLKSYQDSLNPKWKRQISLFDPTLLGSGSDWLVATAGLLGGQDKALAYMRDLVKLEPVVTRDPRLQVEWVARGKTAIGLGIKPEEVTPFVAMGAPIKWIRFSEGVALAPGNSCLAVPQNAAHPNAAVVFVNYLLSKEGADLTVKTAKVPSARRGASIEGLDTGIIPVPGEKSVLVDEDYMLGMPALMELTKPIIAPLMKE